MPKTALFTHPDCLLHRCGPSHPEAPSRLSAILKELERPEFKDLLRFEAPKAEIKSIARVHDETYIERILHAVPKEGYARLDADTALSPGSDAAALRAAGAAIAAVDAILEGKCVRAFCAVRPPGHHAEHASAMGFCLFNSIAVAAAHALDRHGLKRVAIVDFDVHHGNGTQSFAETREGVHFISTHQSPLYPGTGSASEKGRYNNITNIPLPPGTDGTVFRRAFHDVVRPAIEDLAPELILVSAGFDGHASDPLAQFNLREADFAFVTAELCGLAKTFCRGRIMSTLEGGYDLKALAASAGAHVSALLQG